MEKTIGVTGATGFIGRQLVLALKSAGYEPILFKGDICNEKQVYEFVSGCSVIFHLAAKVRGSEEEIFRVNTEGGKNIASAVKNYGNRQVILMSSNYISRYPDSAYSKSKLFTENLLSELSGTNGCSAAIFRFPNIYGPGSKPFHNSAIATFCWYEANGLGDRMPMSGDGSQKIECIPINIVMNTLMNFQSVKNNLKKINVTGDFFSISDLAAIIHDPKKRKNYPALEDEVKFFSAPKPLPQKTLMAHPIHKNASGSFQELIRRNEIETGQLSLCTIEVKNQRGGHYHTRKEEWFCTVQGRMALDFYTKEGEYLQTQLLTADSPKFIHIPPNYLHLVRNIGKEAVRFLIICSEKFELDDADTYRPEVYIM